jgi:hypothetical protein
MEKKLGSDEFIITDELFPTLLPIVVTEPQINNFKDALNQQNSEITKENKITSGWIEIYKVNQKIVYNTDKYHSKPEHTDSTIMNKFVSIMQQKYEKYRDNYDDINGDGSYDETFLTITYETDSDVDEEDDDISVTEDDYEDYIDETY